MDLTRKDEGNPNGDPSSPCVPVANSSVSNGEESCGNSFNGDYELAVNPELPSELCRTNAVGDSIGNSLYSKKWVIQTLMKLTKVVDEEKILVSDCKGPTIVELDEDLESSLCQLWDMTMDTDVAEFLAELPTLDILLDTIAFNRSPRLMEIGVGILGNLACSNSVCDKISSNERLRQSAVALLQTRDPPTLSELMRFLRTCCTCKPIANVWLTTFKESAESLTALCFILQSSTNVELLKNTVEFLFCVLDADDELCVIWSTDSLLIALFEALEQFGYKDIASLTPFITVIHLFSTSVAGLQALVSSAEKALRVFVIILRTISEDPHAFEDYAIMLADILTLLGSLLTNSEHVSLTIVQENSVLHHIMHIYEELENLQLWTRHCCEDSIASIITDQPMLLHKAFFSFFKDVCGTAEGMVMILEFLENYDNDKITHFLLHLEVQNINEVDSIIAKELIKYSDKYKKVSMALMNLKQSVISHNDS